jgi:acyl-coenzyme A synthetase/AMP-(fatty) acid ligase
VHGRYRWVTGHSYIVYGPLANGATVVMYEGAPNTPDYGRFWDIVERHRVNVLYTAPTAIRTFIKWGEQWPLKYDLSSLRLLGSVVSRSIPRPGCGITRSLARVDADRRHVVAN